MTNIFKQLALLFLVIVFAITGCSSGGPGAAAGNLESITESGTLTVVTRNAAISYYINRDEKPAGPEYAMVKSFAESLDVTPEFVIKNSVAGVLAALESGEADLAAASLTHTPARSKRFEFGPKYEKVMQQVVCRSKGNKAKNIDALKDVSLVVIADSSYDERLQEIKVEHPDIAWKTNAKLGTEQLLGQVWKQKIDCTVADSNIVDINRRYYPEILVMFDLSAAQELAWAMPQGSTDLAQAAKSWFADYKKSGKYAAMHTRYFGYIPEFDFVDKRTLVGRIDDRYDDYDHLFEKAGNKHDIPVGLLAAQGYQESHWDPDAKSATGVRGIMMLTTPTAKELGVKDRLDPAQSIAGGARYLQDMQSRLDDSIPSPDRTYFALAAYNIGLAHLRDAQKLTEKMGKNPHSWADVREVLPLLADKRYYPKLKYGYARGTEPVRYVDRIRDYEDVIAKHTE